MYALVCVRKGRAVGRGGSQEYRTALHPPFLAPSPAGIAVCGVCLWTVGACCASLTVLHSIVRFSMRWSRRHLHSRVWGRSMREVRLATGWTIASFVSI